MIGPRMNDRITVYHPTGADNRGNKTGVTTENVRCRINWGNRMIRGPTGAEITSRCEIDTEHPVVAGDMVTPQGESKAWAVLDVRRIDGIGGRVDHYEVYL